MPESTTESTTDTDTTEATEATEGTTEATSEEQLGEEGKAALEKERAARRAEEKARKAAEKRAREAQAKLDEKEKAELTEKERLEREAEEGRNLAAKATETIRRANLLNALAQKGLGGAKGKAAVKLLEDLEYNDDHEPTNLDDRIEAAKATYPAELFKGATPESERKEGDKGGAARPDLHQGARPDADPDEEALMAEYMKHAFPQAQEPAGTA